MDTSTFAYLARRQQGDVALVPAPPGIQANFENPPYATRDAPIFVGVGLTIAGLFIIVRAYTKQFILRNVGAEDGTLAPTVSLMRC